MIWGLYEYILIYYSWIVLIITQFCTSGVYMGIRTTYGNLKNTTLKDVGVGGTSREGHTIRLVL